MVVCHEYMAGHMYCQKEGKAPGADHFLGAYVAL